MKEEKPEFQTLTINSLVKLFYKNLVEYTPKHYTTALHICWALAKRYKETKAIESLDKIYKDSNIGFPLGLLETIAFRDLSQGARVSRIYNYSHNTKPISLMDIIVILNNCEREILDIFTDICVRHEVDVSLTALPISKEVLKGLDDL